MLMILRKVAPICMGTSLTKTRCGTTTTVDQGEFIKNDELYYITIINK